LRGLAGAGWVAGSGVFEGGGLGAGAGLFLSAAPGFRSAAGGVEPGLYRSGCKAGGGFGTTPPGVAPGTAGVAEFASGLSGS
jgi:hypothetical protein